MLSHACSGRSIPLCCAHSNAFPQLANNYTWPAPLRQRDVIEVESDTDGMPV